VAGATGTMSLARPMAGGFGDRSVVGSSAARRLACELRARGDLAVGWTPCIGVMLGGDPDDCVVECHGDPGAILLIAYTIGLGLPFLAIGAGL